MKLMSNQDVKFSQIRVTEPSDKTFKIFGYCHKIIQISYNEYMHKCMYIYVVIINELGWRHFAKELSGAVFMDKTASS